LIGYRNENDTKGGDNLTGDKYLNIEEAASLTGSTTDALYRKVERGQVPYRKWGKRVLFKHSELLEFLDTLPGMRPEDVKRRWDM
jgi:excisionase family DNA binding protein